MRRRVPISVGSIFLTMVASAVVAGLWFGPAAAAPQPGEGVNRAVASPVATDAAAALRALAERLLLPQYGRPDQPGVPSIDLLPGRLPGDLPLDPPAAPNSQLIGSAARRADAKPLAWDVVYDAPGKPADLLAFYQGELAGRGWTAAPVGGRMGGFQPTAMPVTNQPFCQQGGGSWLMLSIFPRPGAPNDVRLHIEANSPGPCAGKPGAPPPDRAGPPGYDKLPPLYPPDGVQVFPSGGGGGSGRFTSEATATTDQGVAALEAHFAAQLAAAGWTRTAGGASGPLAWSVWTIPGEGEWQGFLYVLDGPGKDRRDLSVRIVSGTQSGPGPYGPYGPVPAERGPASGSPVPASPEPLRKQPPPVTPTPAR